MKRIALNKKTLIIKFEGNTVRNESYKLIAESLDEMIHLVDDVDYLENLRLKTMELLARIEYQQYKIKQHNCQNVKIQK